MAISSFSKVDEYGFERSDDFDYETYEDFMSQYLPVLAKRSRRWSNLMKNPSQVRKSAKLKRFVRKGVPSEYRGQIWMLVSGGNDLRRNMGPDFYKNLLTEDLNPDIVETIKLDLPRTFPDNIYFKAIDQHQVMLFNVLAAYAHHNPQVGYCQGLNYVAGLLLLATKSEETSFWLLKILVEQTLEDYYSPTMEGVIVDIEVLSRLVGMKFPGVNAIVSSFGLPWAVITTKWFLCLFAEVLPVETVLRIWDCLFYEGSKILFRAALGLIRNNNKLLRSSEDFTELAENFKMITNNSLVLNCHTFMKSIFQVPGVSNLTITQLRRDISDERVNGTRAKK